MLTRQQHNLLAYLENYHASRGIMPSMDEMRVALELQSKSGVHRLLCSLEERGRIRRLERRARAIELIRGEPVPASPRPGAPVTVPVLGTLVSGGPAPAATGRAREIVAPDGLLGPGEHFAVSVGDGTMRGAGIHEGDLALLRRQSEAEDGQIVLALIAGREAVLRRWRPRGGSIVLVAQAPDVPDLVTARDRVTILGRLAAILRDYR